jgi:hypothetical protein
MATVSRSAPRNRQEINRCDPLDWAAGAALKMAPRPRPARAGCIGAVMVQAGTRLIAGTAVIEPEKDAP